MEEARRRWDSTSRDLEVEVEKSARCGVQRSVRAPRITGVETLSARVKLVKKRSSPTCKILPATAGNANTEPGDVKTASK